jgi:hypothetical protein
VLPYFIYRFHGIGKVVQFRTGDRLQNGSVQAIQGRAFIINRHYFHVRFSFGIGITADAPQSGTLVISRPPVHRQHPQI